MCLYEKRGKNPHIFTFPYLFIVDGILADYSLTIVCWRTMTLAVNTSLWHADWDSFGFIQRSDIVQLCGSSIFSFLTKFFLIFMVDGLIYILNWSVKVIFIFYTLNSICCFFFPDDSHSDLSEKEFQYSLNLHMILVPCVLVIYYFLYLV